MIYIQNIHDTGYHIFDKMSDLRLSVRHNTAPNNNQYHVIDNEKEDVFKSRFNVGFKLIRQFNKEDKLVMVTPKKITAKNSSVKDYKSLMTTNYKNNNTKDSVKSLETSIKRLDANLQQKLIQLNKIRNTKSNKDEFEKKVESDFVLIKKHKKISGIEVDQKNNIVKVYTKDIFCEYDGDTYKLGKYCIEFHIFGKYTRIFILNTNRSYANGYECEAPHVESGGYACFGNITRLLPSLLANGDYYAAIVMIIRYLESFNESDDRALDYIQAFPIVKRRKV